MTKNVRYQKGFEKKIRNKKITLNLESKVSEGVTAVFGKSAYAVIYSGGQNAKGKGGSRTGSVRHDVITNKSDPDYDRGQAVDLYVYNGSGRKITGLNLARLGQWWLANKYGCCGLEMSVGGIHLDEWVIPPRGGGKLWTYRYSNSKKWGAQARQMLVDGSRGIMPGKLLSSKDFDEVVEPNEFVRAIQNLLIAQGFKMEADGFEGPKTEQAIRDWQEQNGFETDGTISNEQLKLLRSGPANPKPIMKSRTMQGGGVAGAGGVAVAVKELVPEVKEAKEEIKSQKEDLRSSDPLTVIIAVAIVAGALYALYARWDDGGRKLPWRKK